ncbi:hypothetical protein C8J37_11210 [Rhizobium sp. PP-WC-1G-195]|nr:hypothetical protein C8J37_11210 [Rhizobium sp. PP-WC-1G-195]
MKIDFSPVVTTVEGTPLKGAPSIREAAITALTMSVDSDVNLPPARKFELGLLAQKIALGSSNLEVSAEEIATIKDRVGKAYGTVVVLFVWQHLEKAGTEKQRAKAA